MKLSEKEIIIVAVAFAWVAVFTIFLFYVWFSSIR